MEHHDCKKEAEDIRNRVMAIVTSPISIEEKAALLDEECVQINICLECGHEFDYYFRQWMEGYAKRYAKLAIAKEQKK